MKYIKVHLPDAYVEKLDTLKEEKNLTYLELIIFLYDNYEAVNGIKKNSFLQENIFAYTKVSHEEIIEQIKIVNDNLDILKIALGIKKEEDYE